MTANTQNTQLEEVEDINEIWNKIKKEKMKQLEKVGKEERPQINSWFDEKCQLILEDRKTAYNKMINRNTRQNEQEYKDKRKAAHKRVDKKKRQLCLNQSSSKRKFLITKIKQINFIEK